jgi:hypothetical protein
MAQSQTLDERLKALAAALANVPADTSNLPALQRFASDAQAASFHLSRLESEPPIVALLGGTGAGKSTIFNRIIGSTVTATSFRRTFTAGPVAAVSDPSALPDKWLKVDAILVDHAQLPAKGQHDVLMMVRDAADLLRRIVLVDTPDLDGDQPEHHAQADRVFRWADAVLFVVTPEKYQMTELLPYYRLAVRYAMPALFAMNKAESADVLEDYRRQLTARGDLSETAADVFAIPRDDAGFEPPPEASLAALQKRLATMPRSPSASRLRGASRRVADLIGRLRDQAMAPWRGDRREIDVLIANLRSIEAGPAGVDVSPVMSDLKRKMQEQSILYLMGPGRMIERVRQVPSLIARLPRTTWDFFRRASSERENAGSTQQGNDPAGAFRTLLVDQFAILQSRIDDLVRGSVRGSQWMADASTRYEKSKLPLDLVGTVADEELRSLREWMIAKEKDQPRDTKMLLQLIRRFPGGENVTRLPEAVPWLLFALNFEPHLHLFHLLTFGGWSLVTWLTEKASNEVANRARQTNQQIADRFAKLVHAQIQKSCRWLDARAPAGAILDELEKLADEISTLAEQNA